MFTDNHALIITYSVLQFKGLEELIIDNKKILIVRLPKGSLKGSGQISWWPRAELEPVVKKPPYRI